MTTALEMIIKEKIVADGPMDIGTYMSLCLTHPDHGYYTTRDPLGAHGDFTTAPEISQVFGEMIGFWIADTWGEMGRPKRVYLVELGPGRGTLMADALRILARIPGFLNAADIHLVEVSEVLAAEQGSRLMGHNITWHDDIDDLPDDAPMIIINNEFFDALPVRQYIKTPTGFDECVVGLSQTGALQLGRVKFPLPEGEGGAQASAWEGEGLRSLPEGAIIELSPTRDNMAKDLYTRIAAQRGACLTIDYGYDTPPGKSTLQALRAHKPVNFFDNPGTADLTALVDFGALATHARACGLFVYGPVGQGPFLTHLGVEARVQNIMSVSTPEQETVLLSGINRLTSPDAMGTLFRVIIGSKLTA